MCGLSNMSEVGDMENMLFLNLLVSRHVFIMHYKEMRPAL